PPPHRDDLRIVSLSPALTRALLVLGLGDRIVGRSRYCTGLPATVPVVGDLREHDSELLVQLHPTDIAVQPPSTGIDPGLEALARTHGWRLHGHRLDTIDDIRSTVRSLGRELAPADPLEAEELSRRAEDALAAIDHGLAELAADPIPEGASPVLLLFSTEPPMAFGQRTYLGELLRTVGGRNAVTAEGYPELSLEDVVRLAPSTVVLVRGDAAGTASFDPLRSLSVPAVVGGRLVELNEPDALIPGPNVVGVAKALRRCLVGNTAAPGSGP
ncbi:MAG: ABC transporter substrate-binding protein, partial [Phycisphaerales bacterium]|nr:ABC transporter substrate-binding protein [Phycisphaerales bacterium]